jgi:hypothetical protein
MNCLYRITVLESFKKLHSELAELQSFILEDAHLPCWLEPLPYPALKHDNPREAVNRLLRQNTYLDGQEGREILIGVGLIGSSAKTLEQAANLNLAKKQFKLSIQTLKAQKLKLTDDWLREAFIGFFENIRHEFTSLALEAAGLSRLHLKQCYRQIPALNKRPLKVSWSWANTRSIKKISKLDAIALLNKKGNDFGIQQQIEKVHGLHATESIAIVQELAPHLRTNIIFSPDDRFMTKGSLPLLYPATLGEALPQVIPPKLIKQSERQTRADLKIDPEVFLPAIRGHKYTHSHSSCAEAQ